MIKIFCNRKIKDLTNFWNNMVFHPTNAIEDDWGRQHLERLAADHAVQTVRIYSMFEECVTLGADGEMRFDFAANDARIDYLLEKGFEPYIVYAFLPGFLSAEQDESIISHRYKDTLLYRSYPTDYAKWQEICRVYTAHIVERYGEERVAKWHLHCYNEPDLKYYFYWNAPDWKTRVVEFCKLYEGFARGITAVSEKLTLGGCGFAETFEFLEYFLDYVREHGLRFDFLSCHSYGTTPEWMIDGSNPLDVKGALYNTVQVRKIAQMCGFGDVPIIVDEWGACTEGYLGTEKHSGFVFRENEIYAAYFAKMLTEFDELGFCEPEYICMSGSHDLKTDFGGHRNFFSKSFYPKPIYNAFVLAAKLGSEKLYHYADLEDEDISVMPTRHADGHLSVLMCYADDLFTRQLKPIDMKVEFTGLDGKYSVTGWRIDAEHANAIRKYKELGLPKNPTEQEKAAIREFGELKPENLGEVSVGDSAVTVHLENNTTLLLELNIK